MPTQHAFKTGARLSPRHELLKAAPFAAPEGLSPAQWPPSLPTFLEMWLNDVDGICVTAEECAAKALYSVVNGLPETKITDATELAFAKKYNAVNGADLSTILDAMAADGFHQDGVTYLDGPKAGVDYSDEAVLQAAIAVGPVKIAIGSGDLPQGAGTQQGWYALTANNTQTDHCVGLWGYGTAEYLYGLLGTAFPGTAFPAALSGLSGYLLYTWSTVGFVSHAWLMNTCQEAWVRNPTTPGVAPGPGPGPTPPPVPVPPAPTPSKLFSLTFRVPVPKGRPVMFRAPANIPAGKYDVSRAASGLDEPFEVDATL